VHEFLLESACLCAFSVSHCRFPISMLISHWLGSLLQEGSSLVQLQQQLLHPEVCEYALWQSGLWLYDSFAGFICCKCRTPGEFHKVVEVVFAVRM
jgi:hypothetical protein